MSTIHRNFIKPRLPRIVITGPPGSGKTTMVKIFGDEFSHLIRPVPEVATMTIVKLGLIPGSPRSEIVFESVFQHMMYRMQELFEHVVDVLAQETGKKALLSDKGRVDIVGHIQGGQREYEKLFNTTLKKDYTFYDLVLFLELPPRKIYNQICKNNPARGETYEDAKATEARVKKAWRGHPNFKLIHNNSRWEDKAQQARIVIADFLKTLDI